MAGIHGPREATVTMTANRFASKFSYRSSVPSGIWSRCLRAVAVKPTYPLIEARFIYEVVGEEADDRSGSGGLRLR
jgi:hypothetical protein